MKRLILVLSALFTLVTGALFAQERAYKEGAVMVVTSIKIKDGQFDNYMDWLDKGYKPLMEAEKKAGIILDYGVFSTDARSPNDPDLYLTVTYPNMASFDGLDDRSEPIMQKVMGQNRAQGNAAFAARSTMREVLGSEMVRTLELK